MAADGPDVDRLLAGLRTLQEEFRSPVADVETESPRLALDSLREAVAQAPREYQDYLEEALACYERGLFRGAILLVWAATVQHLYLIAQSQSGGIAAFERANHDQFGSNRSYRKIKKLDDFRYLRDYDFIQLGEHAGMYNRTIRKMLHQRLDLRNDCGHPTKYQPGREETVIFIESLLLNVIGGRALNW
jgi:hypothetical protein